MTTATRDTLESILAGLPDGAIRINTAARTLSKLWPGRTISLPTLYRWTCSGCRGVRLDSFQVGGTRCVTRDSLAKFFAALSEKGELPSRPAPVRTSAARRRDLAKADRQLDAIGV